MISMIFNKTKFIVCLIFFCVLPQSISLANDQTVNLQLRWVPSFQFAGFYAAQSQNFYQNEGIQVSIQSGFNEYIQLISPIEEVMTGRADFGVDDIQLLNTIDEGGQLVILAPIMQQSATALVTNKGSRVVRIHDLIGKTIKTPADNHLLNELKVLLNAHKINLDQVQFIQGPVRFDDLNSPEIDVLLTYGANAEFYAQTQHLKIDVSYLSDLGSAFYGNVLFTHQSMISEHPKIVDRFLQASIRGWHYALSHEQQIIDELSTLNNHLVPKSDRQLYNTMYAQSMKGYMQWPDVNMGESSISRWHQIYNDLFNGGLIKGGWNVDDYLYSSQKNSRQWRLYFIILVTLTILGFVIVRFNSLQEYRHVFLIGLVIILLMYVSTEYNMSQSHKQSLRYEALQTAQDLTTSLGNYLNNDVILVKNLAAYISINPDLEAQEFLAFCTEIFEQGESLINLAAAPDLIIKMICPVAGNEVVLGADYRQLPAQKTLVFQALQERKTVFSHPMQLIQGGRGFFIRQGVYTSNTEQPWGVVTATVDINKILQKSGVFESATTI
jgi:Predicted periplasmic ligand-binding sensor domain